jgi:hypothetical protein
MKKGERKMKTKEANRPVYAKKVGSVRVAVWANGNEERTYFNVSVARQYRDGEQFKESSSLNGLGDVACLREALRHVADWLSRQEDEAGVEGEE